MKQCSVEGCTTKVFGRGWCSKHYTRWRKYGDVTTVAYIRGDQEAAFRSHYTPGDPDECWEWEGTRHIEGYGHTRWDGKTVNASRVMFFRTHGFWPSVCRHTCDNPPCVNPAHLLDGTHADNTRDKIERGRDVNSTKTACKHGHEFTDDNTYWYVRAESGKLRRMCRRCAIDRTLMRRKNARTVPVSA